MPLLEIEEVDLGNKNFRNEKEDQESDIIDEFRQRIKAEDRFQSLKLDDAYLNRFLYSCRDTEKALIRFKGYYNLMAKSPQFFCRIPPSELTHMMEKNICVFTNFDKDKQGRRIVLVNIGSIDPREMAIEDVVNIFDVWLEWLYEDDLQSIKKGICVVLDVATINWRVLKWLTPSNMRVFFRRLETLAVRDISMHVVNKHFLANTAINLIWPLMPESIKKGVKFHFDDYDSLHELIDPKHLPVEYGGINEVDWKKQNDRLLERDAEILNNLNDYRCLPVINNDNSDEEN